MTERSKYKSCSYWQSSHTNETHRAGWLAHLLAEVWFQSPQACKEPETEDKAPDGMRVLPISEAPSAFSRWV